MEINYKDIVTDLYKNSSYKSCYSYSNFYLAITSSFRCVSSGIRSGLLKNYLLRYLGIYKAMEGGLTAYKRSSYKIYKREGLSYLKDCLYLLYKNEHSLYDYRVGYKKRSFSERFRCLLGRKRSVSKAEIERGYF